MEPITTAGALVAVAAASRPIVKKGVDLIESLLGEPCKVAGSMLADQLYMWQWMNRVRWAARTKELLDENRIAASVVKPSFLLPALEAVGNVDDPDLRELWAHLLASAVAKEENTHPAFIQTLRHFSGTEAKLLTCLATVEVTAAWISPFGGRVDAVVIGEEPRIDLPPRLISLALLNLARLDVVDVAVGIPEGADRHFPDAYAALDAKHVAAFGRRNGVNGFVRMTAFGIALAKACTRSAAAIEPGAS